MGRTVTAYFTGLARTKAGVRVYTTVQKVVVTTCSVDHLGNIQSFSMIYLSIVHV